MIIAIDGASTDLSVALAQSDGAPVAHDAWSSEQRQSAELLPRLLALLERSGRDLGETTLVAVGLGPGSFTGLRVALSIAKGLALGLERPVIGVPSLHAWLVAHPEASAAVARAGAREAYLLRRGEEAAQILDREALSSGAHGALVAPAELAAAFELRDCRSPLAAPAIAKLAAERLSREPAGDDLGGLEPIYVRLPRGVDAAEAGAVRWL